MRRPPPPARRAAATLAVAAATVPAACTLDLVDVRPREDAPALAILQVRATPDPADPGRWILALQGSLEPGTVGRTPRPVPDPVLVVGDTAAAGSVDDLDGRVTWSVEAAGPLPRPVVPVTFPAVGSLPEASLTLPPLLRFASPDTARPSASGDLVFETDPSPPGGLDFLLDRASWQLSLTPAGRAFPALLRLEGQGPPPAEIRIPAGLLPEDAPRVVEVRLRLAASWEAVLAGGEQTVIVAATEEVLTVAVTTGSPPPEA